MRAETVSRGIVYTFLSSVLGAGCLQCHDPAVLPSGRRPGTQEARWVWGGGQSEQARKMLPVPEFEPRIHQPQACRHTD